MQKAKSKLNDISVRTELKSGDMESVFTMHRDIYNKENNYGIDFENYVRDGLSEFYDNHGEKRSCVWIYEHDRIIAGSLYLIDRIKEAQLRFFLIQPEYRGIGLGRILMQKFFEFFNICGFNSAYLWTTNEQTRATELYRRSGFKLTEEIKTGRFGKYLTEQRYDYIKSTNHDGIIN